MSQVGVLEFDVLTQSIPNIQFISTTSLPIAAHLFILQSPNYHFFLAQKRIFQQSI